MKAVTQSVVDANVVLCVWLVACLAAGSLAAAQVVAPLPIESALNTKAFGDLAPLALSPDGRRLVYTVRSSDRARAVSLETWLRTGVRDVFTGTDLHVLDLDTGQERDLTGGSYDNFMPTWCEDGRDLIFLSDRDGSGYAKIWMWDSRTSEIRKLADQTVTATEIECTPNGSAMVVTVPPEHSRTEGGHDNSRLSTGDSTFGAAESANVRVYRSATSVQDEHSNNNKDRGLEPWSLDWALRRIAVVDIRSGRLDVITPDERLMRFRVSPDGLRMAYSVMNRFASPGSQQILFDLKVADLKSGRAQVVAKGIRLGFNGYFAWSPDSSRLTYREFTANSKSIDSFVVDVSGRAAINLTRFSGAGFRDGPSSEMALWDSGGESIFFITAGALWKGDVRSGRASELSRVPDRQIKAMIPQSANLLWTPDGGRSTIVLTHDDQQDQEGFYRIDLRTGQSRKLLENETCLSCTDWDYPFAVGRDLKSIFYYVQDAGHSPDLWMGSFDLSTPKRLTHLNPQFDEYKMGSARLISWLSSDGEKLRGVLLLPSQYKEGDRYPLITWPYAGANLSYALTTFGLAGQGSLNLQLLATRGFAVLLPDSPQQLGSPMLALAKTVLPGVNKAIEMGVADPRRLGVFGHSNGGYSVLALIVLTNRFKAAVAVDGMGDLLSAYGQMDKDGAAFFTSLLENGSDGLGGTPWQVPMRYLENSPVFYLDRVKTPLLIAHGAADRTVAPFLADEIYVAMRRLGKEVEYAKYGGESHSPADWTYENQKDFCARVIRWFDDHLKEAH